MAGERLAKWLMYTLWVCVILETCTHSTLEVSKTVLYGAPGGQWSGNCSTVAAACNLDYLWPRLPPTPRLVLLPGNYIFGGTVKAHYNISIESLEGNPSTVSFTSSASEVFFHLEDPTSTLYLSGLTFQVDEPAVTAVVPLAFTNLSVCVVVWMW